MLLYEMAKEITVMELMGTELANTEHALLPSRSFITVSTTAKVSKVT